MKLSKLLTASGIEYPRHLSDVEISSVTSDTRKIKEGSLFVCQTGTREDGNERIDEAYARGAFAVISDKRPDADVFVPDARYAEAKLCRTFYGQGIEGLHLIGVTGTNGKTSVTAMLRSIFNAAGEKTGSIGTLGSFSPSGEIPDAEGGNMTTPDAGRLYGILSQMAADGAKYVFLEVSSHALALKKADALRFDVGIFTNITRDHLDFHKTKENYFEAKKRIFELSRVGIVNADDEMLANIPDVLTCSARKNADFRASDIKYYGADGCGYVFSSELCRFGIASRIAGRFTVMNTLCAAAGAVTLGVDPYYIKDGIWRLSTVPGRMERVALDGADFAVYIDYAHTPDALENLLMTARSFAKRIILVFGCGGERDQGKRAEMAKIATRLADRVIITSDNRRGEPQSKIFDDILAGVDKNSDHVLIEDRREAIEYAVRKARRGDVILLAGKGHEKYEINEHGKHPFCEELLVQKAYKMR